MIITSTESERKGILQTANAIMVAARTAPKTRGIDNIETLIITEKEKQEVADKMKEIGEKIDKPFFLRDAECLEKAECAVILGVRLNTMGLNCGYCGYPTCEEAEENEGVCAFNNIDLGIAIGSAASVAMDNRVDNRVMFSIGKAVLELGYFTDSVKIAFGIPLASYGKNIFFDRKTV